MSAEDVSKIIKEARNALGQKEKDLKKAYNKQSVSPKPV